MNYTVGIKLPSTLHSEENWNRTHCMAGVLWIAGGLIIAAASLLRGTWLPVTVLTTLVLVPFVYSYLLYKKEYRFSTGHLRLSRCPVLFCITSPFVAKLGETGKAAVSQPEQPYMDTIQRKKRFQMSETTDPGQPGIFGLKTSQTDP